MNVFIDSGAFSAFTNNVTIDIDAYISFLQRNINSISLYANLDVIGNAEETLKNQKRMEEFDLKPIPCFHEGEDFKYLDYYVNNYDYISLGGIVGGIPKNIINFLDKCFLNYICNSETRLPKVKVHGFGITSLFLILRYPWYSVDSTSWALVARMGDIYVPPFKDGQYNYDKNVWRIAVSTRSPAQKDIGEHITTLSPLQQKIIITYIESKGYKLGKSEFKIVDADYEPTRNEQECGKAINGKKEVEIILERGLSNDYRLRGELNILYYKDLEASRPVWPWALKTLQNKRRLL